MFYIVPRMEVLYSTYWFQRHICKSRVVGVFANLHIGFFLCENNLNIVTAKRHFPSGNNTNDFRQLSGQN